jgi:D-sedoheptulose 7-phosphate isomerase
MHQFIISRIENSIKVKESLLQPESVRKIAEAGHAMSVALKNNKKLLICGNGGSAADAQHMAAELMIRYKSGNNRPSIPAISLSSDSSALTAGGNDFGFDEVFARQTEGLGQEGDVLLGITTSGNSENILRAFKMGRKKKMVNILLSGGKGGCIVSENADLLDYVILVDSSVTAHVQESHITIIHLFCALIEKELYNLD